MFPIWVDTLDSKTATQSLIPTLEFCIWVDTLNWEDCYTKSNSHNIVCQFVSARVDTLDWEDCYTKSNSHTCMFCFQVDTLDCEDCNTKSNSHTCVFCIWVDTLDWSHNYVVHPNTVSSMH